MSDILISFLAPLFGVLAAFGIERCWEHRKDKKGRVRILSLVKKELETVFEKLRDKPGHLVQLDTWETLVASGRALLLDKTFLKKYNSDLFAIAKTYFKIKMYNYEAKGVNFFRFRYLLSQGTKDEIRLDGILKERGKHLKDNIHKETLHLIKETVQHIDNALQQLDC